MPRRSPRRIRLARVADVLKSLSVAVPLAVLPCGLAAGLTAGLCGCADDDRGGLTEEEELPPDAVSSGGDVMER